ncbi:DUF1513 domain-containing protein [Beggiatoa leptomitoformis]|uniref:DUF1513 domain-containing protein n=1 Tax=Beggiatoa leptomitoformis TaxID=288004 RepID=A0A2N9Y9U1_9GAMM|nr:DUF1513 domain-containing protein [Beggiatoa leptomitoformis]AUI67233.1 DUF1513 domain-containing protein [Beggiatoa leptomitoformis]QGX03593.1 DUF1513 domain-containing protein [Beggiatoa leptomitoformis]
MLSRRHFLQFSAGFIASYTLLVHAAVKPSGLFLSAYDDSAGQHCVAGFNTAGEKTFSLVVNQRGHGLAVHPTRADIAVLLARRPGTEATIFNYRTGEKIQILQSTARRHFFGHGCFSNDGQTFFTTENDFEKGVGIIGVYDALTFNRLSEMQTYGIDSHELCLMSDGKTLVIANGGIETRPESGRQKLNLPTMSPSLTYINSQTGELLEKQILAHSTLSIRHLAINGHQVAIALQEEGEDGLPLVALHQSRVTATGFNQQMQASPLDLLPIPDEVLLQMKAYTASAAIATPSQILGITCPRGNFVAFWSLVDKTFLKTIPLIDTAGITFDANTQQFVITAGTGEIIWINAVDLTTQQQVKLEGIHWDNHLLVV